MQEYVLFLEYFKLIVNCSCVQNKKQETKRDISPGCPQNLVEQSSRNNLLNTVFEFILS